jgi:GT2 family glycosyltransferase
VTVIDNGSADGTLTRLEPWRGRGVRVLAMGSNLYYARAHNLGIRETESELVLTLNPDACLRPDYLSAVARAFALSPCIGSVNGRLLLLPGPTPDLDSLLARPVGEFVLDGAGLLMRRSRRPHLRGAHRPAHTTCMEAASIFGADGACAAYRRAMLEDTAVEGENLDEDFVMYREDVDLAWRAQLFGWDSYYAPDAVGYHVRGVHVGQSRRSIPTELRRQSVKNGWLLVIKNDTLGALARDAAYVAPYQARILAGLLTIERSSLPAIADLLRLLPAMRRKRALIQARRRRPDAEMRRWFE